MYWVFLRGCGGHEGFRHLRQGVWGWAETDWLKCKGGCGKAGPTFIRRSCRTKHSTTILCCIIWLRSQLAAAVSLKRFSRCSRSRSLDARAEARIAASCLSGDAVFRRRAWRLGRRRTGGVAGLACETCVVEALVVCFCSGTLLSGMAGTLSTARASKSHPSTGVSTGVSGCVCEGNAFCCHCDRSNCSVVLELAKVVPFTLWSAFFVSFGGVSKAAQGTSESTRWHTLMPTRVDRSAFPFSIVDSVRIRRRQKDAFGDGFGEVFYSEPRMKPDPATRTIRCRA